MEEDLSLFVRIERLLKKYSIHIIILIIGIALGAIGVVKFNLENFITKIIINTDDKGEAEKFIKNCITLREEEKFTNLLNCYETPLYFFYQKNLFGLNELTNDFKEYAKKHKPSTQTFNYSIEKKEFFILKYDLVTILKDKKSYNKNVIILKKNDDNKFKIVGEGQRTIEEKKLNE